VNVIGYGIDVSRHQEPAALPWSSWLGQVDFVIARAGYGRTRDPRAVEHIARARDIGAKVGLYVFFRVVEPVEAQLANLKSVAAACGLDGRDIVPAIDIEADGERPVEPAWSEHAEKLATSIVEEFGNCLVYSTQADWRKLGAPAWLLRCPLWVPHWTAAPIPASPGGVQPTLWQHRVGPFKRDGDGGTFLHDGTPCRPGQQPEGIDQSRQLKPLPMIGQVVTSDERDRIEAQVLLALADEARRVGGGDKSMEET
jgi:hypothetical protein